MPLRKSASARTEVATMATAGTPAGFTYVGFPQGVVDSETEVIAEVSLLSGEASAKTVRIVHYNAAGTVVDDITTASFTTVVGKAADGTLSTNTKNTGNNFPWVLTNGDSVLVTAVSAGSINATFLIAAKGA